jgi:hypothetical protein
MEGTLMEFWVTASLAGLGHDEDNGVRLVEGFNAVHPAGEPVADQNVATGTLSVTFGLDALDVDAAYREARPLVAAGLASAGLEGAPVLGLHIRTAAVDEYYDVPRAAAR